MNETAMPPNLDERDARRWATICHVSALVGFLANGIGFVLAPLVIWLIKRNDHPYIDEQGKEAVNFQITMFLAALISIPLCLVVIGVFLLIIIAVMLLVFPIIAGIRTSEGEHYLYPLAIRFIK
jgi:uncharacterized Tic20 family protein